MHLDLHIGRPAQLLPALLHGLPPQDDSSSPPPVGDYGARHLLDLAKSLRSRRLLEGQLLTGVGDTLLLSPKPPPASTLPARNTTTIALLLTLKKTSRKSMLITRRIMKEFILVYRQTAVYAYTKKNHVGFILVTRIKALSKQF